MDVYIYNIYYIYVCMGIYILYIRLYILYTYSEKNSNSISKLQKCNAIENIETLL